MEKDTLGDRIRSQRLKKGYSQEQLAELSRLSLRTVQRIENGETEPRGDTLTRLAKELDVEISEFVDKPAAPVSAISSQNYLALINLLGLTICFYYVPLLSIIAPGVCWLLKRDSLPDVYQDGKKIMNFQFTWSIPFYIFFYGFPIFRLYHLEYSSEMFQAAIAILLFNVVSVLINTVRILNRQPVKYWLSIRFLK